MPVTITINSDTASEAIQEFSALSAAFTGGQPVVEEPPKAKARKSTPVKEPVVEKPQEEVTQPDPEPNSGADDDIPTVVQLRAKAQEVGKDPANKPKIKALLNKFESPNISEVPEDKRAAFMVELEAL